MPTTITLTADDPAVQSIRKRIKENRSMFGVITTEILNDVLAILPESPRMVTVRADDLLAVVTVAGKVPADIAADQAGLAKGGFYDLWKRCKDAALGR